MARLVKHTATKPHKLEIAGETKWICACGLSQNKPYCDGSHRACHDEEDGKVYTYTEGERKELH